LNLYEIIKFCFGKGAFLLASPDGELLKNP